MNLPAFFSSIRSSLFSGRLSPSQVEGINAILDAWAEHGDGDLENLAYCLATAYHETGQRMVPVREGFCTSDAAARALVARAGRRYATPIDGKVYYGRGIVQLTWADNYRSSSKDAGVDLLADPDKALDPAIGARLLVVGILDGRWNAMGLGIDAYLKGPSAADDDLQGARRTVNVTDRWELIGGYYKKFRTALVAAGYGLEPPPPKPAEVLPPSPSPAPAPTGLEEAVASWILSAPPHGAVLEASVSLGATDVGRWLALFPEVSA